MKFQRTWKISLLSNEHQPLVQNPAALWKALKVARRWASKAAKDVVSGQLEEDDSKHVENDECNKKDSSFDPSAC